MVTATLWYTSAWRWWMMMMIMLRSGGGGGGDKTMWRWMIPIHTYSCPTLAKDPSNLRTQAAAAKAVRIRSTWPVHILLLLTHSHSHMDYPMVTRGGAWSTTMSITALTPPHGSGEPWSSPSLLAWIAERALNGRQITTRFLRQHKYGGLSLFYGMCGGKQESDRRTASHSRRT